MSKKVQKFLVFYFAAQELFKSFQGDGRLPVHCDNTATAPAAPAAPTAAVVFLPGRLK